LASHLDRASRAVPHIFRKPEDFFSRWRGEGFRAGRRAPPFIFTADFQTSVRFSARFASRRADPLLVRGPHKNSMNA
jgi:hypothetical protein